LPGRDVYLLRIGRGKFRECIVELYTTTTSIDGEPNEFRYE
jgi:hypothetical protein